jgi:GNAT superfamily N-acetyltransferase
VGDDVSADRYADQRGALRAWSEGVERDLGLEALDVYPSGDDLELSLLKVPRGVRRSGRGTAAMQRLVALADARGKRLVLTPALRDPHAGTTSRARLVKFYKRFGFVENKGRRKDFTTSAAMYREPRGSR